MKDNNKYYYCYKCNRYYIFDKNGEQYVDSLERGYFRKCKQCIEEEKRQGEIRRQRIENINKARLLKSNKSKGH